MNIFCKWFGHSPEEIKEGIRTVGYKCSKCGEEEKWDSSFRTGNIRLFLDNWGIVFVAIGVVLGFLLMLSVPFVLAEYAACSKYVEMGVPAKWTGIWTGCMAEHPQFGWVPVDNYFQIIGIYAP